MEDRELRERLSRIESCLGLDPYERDALAKKEVIPEKEEKQPEPVKVKTDRIGELLTFIEEKKKEVKEEAFLAYLKKMEEVLCREQVRIDDLAANLMKNYDVYLERQNVKEQPEKAVQPEPEPAVEVIPVIAPKETKKTDVEFGIGAAVLSVVGALFIIAALVIFALNFMDNLQQGIFYYVLAGVVIAFSELRLRKHLERFSQAVTGIGVCVLYTATILNYLYLHTMNSPVALAATIAVSVFALLLSRKRESASLRIIGILGCYISLMPLDEFESRMEFVIPCVILCIVNVIYLLLPVSEKNAAVRNVHSAANVVAAGYLTVTAWMSGLPAVWMFALPAAMILIQYFIYYGTGMQKSRSIFYITGQILLHAMAAFVMCDEKFYIPVTLVLALIDGLGIRLCRDKSIRWAGLHCFAVYYVIVCTSLPMREYLVGVAVLYALYRVLSYVWNEQLRTAGFIISVFSACVFLANMGSSSNMQYVLLAVMVLSVAAIKHDKVFHEICLMTVLWFFGLFGFDTLEIALPLSVIFLLACVILFTRVEGYKSTKVQILTGFAWTYNAISLFASLFEISSPGRISMTVFLVAESLLLVLLISKACGTGEEKVVRGRAHALAFFFTYMVFAYHIELPIAVSILLMVIAVACVGAGFVLKIKSLRIYGLCLSLFVCGKLLLVDFADAQSADRVISFFVVGVIALAISYLYMRIERSLTEKENL